MIEDLMTMVQKQAKP